MQAYLTLVRREIGSHFLSWSGYFIIASTAFLSGLSMVILVESLGNEPTHRPLTELFFASFSFWMVLLLAPPVITMRTFSAEKASGTFETLMTTPVSDSAVVLAKFTGAMLVYAVLWLPLIPTLMLMQRFSHEGPQLDAGVVASAMLGVYLLGMVFVAMGCLASAFTRSQTVAAVISFCAGAAMLLLGFLSLAFSGEATPRGMLLSQLSLIEHMQDFASGVADTRPLVLYLSLTGFFLFFTKRVVESRRWK